MPSRTHSRRTHSTTSKTAAVREARTKARRRERAIITEQAIALGARMRALRERRGLSQLDIGEACAVTRAAVSLWERGESLPEYDNLVAAALRLNCSVGYLRDGEGEPEVMAIDVPPGAGKSSLFRRALRPIGTTDSGSWSDDAARPPFDGAVPEMASGVGAGLPYQPGEPVRDWWRLPPTMLDEGLRAETAHLRIFKVRSDTMAPDIKRGAYVLVDLAQNAPADGAVFALDNGISIVLKRFVVDPARRGFVGLVDGGIDWVKLARVKIVGRVIAQLAYL